jgi:putative phage-type endonuclease
MSCDKAVQTYETDIINEMENIQNESDSEDDSSETNTIPLYDRMSDSDQAELIESIHVLIDEYMEGFVLKMSNPDFHTEFVEDICHVLFQQLTDVNICKDTDYDELYSIVAYYCDCYNKENLHCPLRHIPHQLDNLYELEYGLDNEFIREHVAKKIQELREKDELSPKQRSKEWFERRYNMMTASNMWQLLGSDAQRNRFIYDKCKPLSLDIVESKWVNTEGSLHWGVKYEPLTTMVYEKMTGGKVELFGCIQHSEHSFIGASPDGIVTNPESPLYGRLVEIKNIYNREMDGIPSEAYWIQIQIQLECCDLDFCDFVETRFKEYESEESYLAETDDERIRGIILHMVPRDGKSNIPLYQYMPLDTENKDIWIEDTKRAVEETYVTYNTIYWYLDDIQMTTITKNEKWFSAALPHFKNSWATIQNERVIGYEHRAPKKRTPTEVIVVDSETTAPNPHNICVIKLSPDDTLT